MKVALLGIQDGFPQPLGAPAYEGGGSAFVIETDSGSLILLDAPPGINFSLLKRGINPLSISGLCITHLHNDHIGGRIEFLQFRTLVKENPELWEQGGYLPKDGKIQDLFVFSPVTNFKKWFLFTFFKSMSLNGAAKYRSHLTLCDTIEDFSEHLGITVSVKEGKHTIECYGFKFGNVGISGDTEYSEDMLEWLTKGTDKVFHELGYGKGHTTIIKAYKIKDKIPDVIFYHIPGGLLNNLGEEGIAELSLVSGNLYWELKEIV